MWLIRTHSLLQYQKSGRKICQMWHLNTTHLNSSIWAISISLYSCRGIVWGLENKPQHTQADLASSCQCSTLLACLCHRTVRSSHTLTPIHMHTYKQHSATDNAAPEPFHYIGNEEMPTVKSLLSLSLCFILVWVSESASHRKTEDRNASSKQLSTAQNVCAFLPTYLETECVWRRCALLLNVLGWFYNYDVPISSP